MERHPSPIHCCYPPVLVDPRAAKRPLGPHLGVWVDSPDLLEAPAHNAHVHDPSFLLQLGGHGWALQLHCCQLVEASSSAAVLMKTLSIPAHPEATRLCWSCHTAGDDLATHRLPLGVDELHQHLLGLGVLRCSEWGVCTGARATALKKISPLHKRVTQQAEGSVGSHPPPPPHTHIHLYFRGHFPLFFSSSLVKKEKEQ